MISYYGGDAAGLRLGDEFHVGLRGALTFAARERATTLADRRRVAFGRGVGALRVLRRSWL